MRKEKEMMACILQVAREDERVRAVYLNGSRTNPNVPKDIFQDYDVVYVVTETRSFIEEEHWIDMFGKQLYMQLPDDLDQSLGKDVDLDCCYTYLMQLDDGNRIDLKLMQIEVAKEEITKDKLAMILLDKDGILPEIPEATDEDYWVKKPVEAEFRLCCNEFWWCLNNVAKGLWREEIPYTMDMIDCIIRMELKTMLSWYVGITTGFSCSVGKSGKYLDKYLPEEIWTKFLRTYSVAEVQSIWEAVFVMCELFHEVALLVGDRLGFEYNKIGAENSLRFLKDVRELPKTAKDIYK